MIAVIIAGGSGTRLWPLSTPDYPKQLLRVADSERSLLQTTYDRARSLTDTVYVMPESRLTRYMIEQLPELDNNHLIIEPALRGTANCVVAALTHIAKAHDHAEPIAFLWADHYIRDLAGYVHSFRIAAETSQATRRIVLVGVEPDYPATGFGYIEKGEVLDDQTFVCNVRSFQEKPPYETAQNYVESGNYLWNAGYSVGSVETFVSAMRQYAPTLYDNYERLSNAVSSEDYQQVYLGFETAAIDYALIEKTPDLLVVPASFDWLDLGSFADMYKAVNHDERGNHIQGPVQVEKVENSYIQNNETKPVIVIGLDNVAVVNTPDGLLVTRKDLSQEVGVVSKRLAEPTDLR